MIFTGQNKNNNLVLALLWLVHLGEFDRVELAYLVSGHSYMPCDRKFGNIAQDLSKYESIASPALLEEYIRASQSPACNVFQLKREEIQNINVLSSTDKTKRVVLIRRKGNREFISICLYHCHESKIPRWLSLEEKLQSNR